MPYLNTLKYCRSIIESLFLPHLQFRRACEAAGVPHPRYMALHAPLGEPQLQQLMQEAGIRYGV